MGKRNDIVLQRVLYREENSMKRYSASLTIREMKLKPQWAITTCLSKNLKKNWYHQMQVRMWINLIIPFSQSFIQCWWVCKMVQSLWRTAWHFLIKLNMQLQHNPAIRFLAIYSREIEINTQEKSLYTNVYSSFILNSHKLDITQMSFTGWMIKQIGISMLWSTTQEYFFKCIDTNNLMSL